MQNQFSLLDTDVMPICIIIALDIVITLRFSINCSTVICSPIVLFSFKPKNPKIHCCTLFIFTLFYVLVIFYTYLYQISPLQLTVKGLTTPLSRWVQVFIVCVGAYIRDL